MGEDVVSVPCASLIFDWGIWPRHEANSVDYTNVMRMVDAIKAGIELPPIIVDKKTMRIVDGFHRTKAHEKVYGESAKIRAIMREYKSDKDVFVDAVALNARQGLPLSPMDKAHVIIRAKELKLPMEVIARALGITPTRAKEFFDRRSIKFSDGARWPIAAGASKLARELNKNGEKPDEDQERFFAHANGMFPIMNARLVLLALRARGSFKPTKEAIALLKELRDEIERVIESIECTM
jgi:hypothetical protein